MTNGSEFTEQPQEQLPKQNLDEGVKAKLRNWADKLKTGEVQIGKTETQSEEKPGSTPTDRLPGEELQ